MAYTAAQQKRLDDAQNRLDNAKASYNGQVDSYNTYASAIAPCYTNAVPSASDASTWFNSFNKGPCTGKGSCDLSKCKDRVDVLNTIIPKLKSAYSELNNAQSNYNQVLDEVTKESLSDPTNILTQQQQQQAADLAEQQLQISASQRNKNIIFALIAVVVLGAIAIGIIRATSKN